MKMIDEFFAFVSAAVTMLMALGLSRLFGFELETMCFFFVFYYFARDIMQNALWRESHE